MTSLQHIVCIICR